MILLADSGSTKTDWSLVTRQGKVVASYKTQGINPFHFSDEEILHVLGEELSLTENPTEVYFYGSGVTEGMKPRMEQLLAQAFVGADAHAESDLLGAARALFGMRSGIACILGTGANSGYYDGKQIVHNVPPLGYILGDEGSGAVLGKLFINAIFKGRLLPSIKEKYLQWSGLDYATIINKVYRQPLANRFLASIARFISGVIDEGNKIGATAEQKDEAVALSRLVEDNFEQFYQNNIVPYLQLPHDASCMMQVGFVGSIAQHFESSLRIVFEDRHQLGVAQIMPAPMAGLIRYHAQ